MDGVMRKTQENSLTTKINNNYIKNLPNGVIGFSYDRSTLKGGILHIDDYGLCPGVRSAIDEFFFDKHIWLHRVDISCRYLIKK